MTYKTHQIFSVSGAFLVGMFINRSGLSGINYYLALIILIRLSEYGARFPDVDHSWKNVKEKTLPNWFINKAIHLTGGRHRSWQTHSWDIAIIVCLGSYLIPKVMASNGLITDVNREVLNIILMGFCSGWISHLLSDMLSSGGVRVICFINKTVAFVPKVFKLGYGVIPALGLMAASFCCFFFQHYNWCIALCAIGIMLIAFSFKMRGFRFNTGNEWEALVYKIERIINAILGFICLFYPLIDKLMI